MEQIALTNQKNLPISQIKAFEGHLNKEVYIKDNYSVRFDGWEEKPISDKILEERI